MIFCLFLMSNLKTAAQSKEYFFIINSESSVEEKIQDIDILLENELHSGNILDFQRDCNSYSTWLYKKDKLPLSIAALKHSIKHIGVDSSLFARRYLKLGFVQRKSELFKNSIQSYRKAINFGLSKSETIQAYMRIADCYYELSDYQTSKKIFRLCLLLINKETNYKQFIKTAYTSFNTFSEIEDYATMKELENNLLLADSLTLKNEISKVDVFQVKTALTLFYGDYESKEVLIGDKFAKEALSLAFKIKDSVCIANAYLNNGLLLTHENPNTTLKLLKKALQFNPKTNVELSQIIQANIGLNLAKVDSFEMAINIQESLIEDILECKLTKENIIISIRENAFNENLRTILSNLAETYYLNFKKNRNFNDLEESIKYFEYSDYLLDTYFESGISEQAKLSWRKEAALIYSRAIRSCYEANDIITAHKFIEKSKALLLFSERTEQYKLQQNKITSENLNLIRTLKRNIKQLEKSNTRTLTDMQFFLDTKENLEILLEKSHSKQNSETTSEYLKTINLKDIQSDLNSNQAIIEYHISTDDGYGLSPNTKNGYIILITRTFKKMFKIENLTRLKTLVNNTLPNLQKKQTTLDESNALNKQLRELSRILLPEQIIKDIKGKNIFIIPDNYLSSIPFETLITSKNDHPIRYFIQDHEISYQFSYSFNAYNKKFRNLDYKKHKLKVFAPVYFKNNSDLPYTEKEANLLLKHFSGIKYLHQDATLENFTTSLQNTDIIHLATHANAALSTPAIYLSNGSISFDELSTYPNNASLVVLSACETTKGKIENGEGTLSLARSFFYGGAQSTLSTLWKVDDRATSIIMNSFYSYLRRGMKKSSALHKAKIDYIESNSGSELSPYFWSSLIITGSIDPIIIEQDSLKYILIIILSILFLVALVMLSRKRNI